MAARDHRRGIGNWIAPPRFLLFILALAAGMFLAVPPLGLRYGTMAAFDGAALLFFATCAPLLWHQSTHMRRSARRNDANRVILLLLTLAVSFVILAAVASELMERGQRHPWALPLIVGTLALSWLFSNFVY